MAKQKKYVYSFGGGKAEGRAEMKELLGGKGGAHGGRHGDEGTRGCNETASGDGHGVWLLEGG